jgi:hypothetical protein
MGVKLTASKTKTFGDMKMRTLNLFGELSLAPLVLNDLTTCWLPHMAAYEACLGARQADNFAVNSYVSIVALLVNRCKDVQEHHQQRYVRRWNSHLLQVGGAVPPHRRTILPHIP